MYGPISPHLLIYKPQFSSMLSVLHRTAGAVLALAVIFSLFGLVYISNMVSFYATYKLFYLLNTYMNWFVIGLVWIVLLAFCYHISNGIRHLIWDFGNGSLLNREMVKKTGYFVIINCIFCFIAFWLLLNGVS